MNMTACLCGNEFPTHTSAGRVQCYTCSSARLQHAASTRDRVAAMWDVIPRLSCAEIGRRMVPEMTKSAVIGIAHRMGLKIRTPANARWGPGKARLPRRLRAHVAFGGALPTGAVTLPALASAISNGARPDSTESAGVSVKAPRRHLETGRDAKSHADPGESPGAIQAARKPPEAPKPPAAPKRQREPETLLPRAGTPPRWGLCQWPSGERPFKWCGKPVEGFGPYCPSCRKIAYNRPVPFRDAATESAAA